MLVVNSSHNTTTVIAACVACVLIAIIICIAVICVIRLKHKKRATNGTANMAAPQAVPSSVSHPSSATWNTSGNVNLTTTPSSPSHQTAALSSSANPGLSDSFIVAEVGTDANKPGGLEAIDNSANESLPPRYSTH